MEVFVPSARRFCLLYVQFIFVPFLKGFKLKVFLFHMSCFHGTNPVRVVDQLDLPNSALKSRVFAKPEALQYLYVGSVSEKMNLSRTGISGLVTLLEICNKVLYQSFYIKLVFSQRRALIKTRRSLKEICKAWSVGFKRIQESLVKMPQ